MRSAARHIGLVATEALVCLAAGCVSPHQSAAADVDPGCWIAGAQIVLHNADTVTLRDAVVFLRCNDRFTEDTLTVRIATVAPDSLRFEETFLLDIPGTGTPAALAQEIDIPYRRRICFGQAGDYRFTVTPVRPVRGIEAVGIDLKTNN